MALFGLIRRVFVALAILGLVLPPARGETKDRLAQWEPEMAAFEARDRTNPPPQHAILFVGSSSIRFWRSLDQDFAGFKVINRGFGGSQIVDSTALAERIIFPYHPATIVFYAGDNDLAAGKSADEVASDYKAFVERVHGHLPETRILFISIKPCPLRWALRDKVAEANRQIAAMKEPYLGFVDVYSRMLDADGKPQKGLYKADGLHPSEECYRLWTGMIKPELPPPGT